MARELYVTRIYKVRLPKNKEEEFRVQNAIAANNSEADTYTIVDSDVATATYLTHEYDSGNFQDLVEVEDVVVSDSSPWIDWNSDDSQQENDDNGPRYGKD